MRPEGPLIRVMIVALCGLCMSYRNVVCGRYRSYRRVCCIYMQLCCSGKRKKRICIGASGVVGDWVEWVVYKCLRGYDARADEKERKEKQKQE